MDSGSIIAFIDPGCPWGIEVVLLNGIMRHESLGNHCLFWGQNLVRECRGAQSLQFKEASF